MGWSPLRLDLGPLGAPGCTLLNSVAFAALWTVADGLGQASYPSPLPTDPGLNGLTLHVQWMLLDPGVNPVGATFSDALEVRFQL